MKIDQLIPREWRLAQCYDDGTWLPARYPVFVKPEWGQNARGVQRADSAAELAAIRARIKDAPGEYLIQQGADERIEYEIFAMRQPRDASDYAVLTVTEARNRTQRNPINSVRNAATRYVDITDSFSREELARLWALIQRIGSFAISRTSVRADSTAELLRGKLHVIEVNLFAPLPIHLLDRRRRTRGEVYRLAFMYMLLLARATRHRVLGAEPAVFTHSVRYGRRGRRFVDNAAGGAR